MERVFVCDVCQKSYTTSKHLTRHQKSHEEATYSCHICQEKFVRQDNLTRHLRNAHKILKRSAVDKPDVPAAKKIRCDECPAYFDSRKDLEDHQTLHIQQGGRQPPPVQDLPPPPPPPEEPMEIEQEAINGLVREFLYVPKPGEQYDLLKAFQQSRNMIKYMLTSEIGRRGRAIKWYLSVQVKLEKHSPEGIVDRAEPHFRSTNYTYMTSNDVNDHELNEAYQKMYASFEEFIRHGSNWRLKKVIKLKLHVLPYRPLGGSSYIDLPHTLRKSKCITNIQNTDEKCFLWSVLAALHPVRQDQHLLDHYRPYQDELNMTGITYPVTVQQIDKFEDQNNMSINVFGFDKNIYPLRISKSNDKFHVDLLLLTEGKKTHYCLIRDLNRFLSRTKTRQNEHFFCPLCLHGFRRKDLLNAHKEYCGKFGTQKTTLPAEGSMESVLHFKEIHKQMKVPFVIYADFECYSEPAHICSQDPSESNSTVTTKFTPCSFGYVRASIDERYDKPPIIYRGSNVVETFINYLMEEEREIQHILEDIEPMVMTQEDQETFDNTAKCYLCNNYFKNNKDKVRDHCHVTGKFRGAACNKCNLQFKQPKHIPVFLHNMSRFDGHILCDAIGKYKEQNITCIAQNMENYISFSLGNLRFLDSCRFMPSSLDTLVTNLKDKGHDNFKYFNREFTLPEHREVLLRKGVYPYQYLTDSTKFSATQLPSKSSFYSELSEEDITQEDYDHAQRVWQVCDVKHLGDYTDLYLKCDCLLLADVFEAYRTLNLDNYQLDPCHFYTSPGLAWSAALKMTGVTLELLTDIDMHQMVEMGIRGGVSGIMHRYANANNRYIPETYDPTKPTSYITSYDANNLYGCAMSEYLPHGGFTWLTDVEISQLDISTIPKEGQYGYILEVDMQYPSHLHSIHSDYPLAPENRCVNKDELSDYSKTLWRSLSECEHKHDCLDHYHSTQKLISNLHDKERYVVHYRNLQFYLDQGMILTTIHRVIKFKQSPWLKPYIEFNTNKRKQASNDFEKDYYKLKNNAVFGKTMENLRNRVDIKLIHSEDRLCKYCAKPSFQQCRIFNEDLVGVQMLKTNLLLNRPVYVGFTVLDLSKLIMYDFHYNYMKQNYGQNTKLLFTDTDSLTYLTHTDDIYADIFVNLDLFDTSNYPIDDLLYSTTNKKVLGKMKDETGGNPIKEFVGLRAKMYSYVYGDRQKRTAKGVARAVIKHCLHHQLYKECLFDQTVFYANMHRIQSTQHQLHIVSQNKVTLNSFDDKRYILNGINTLPYGHYKIGQ
ncbi:uncharacterized protein LOC117344073 [Pecten maximus]|uniref:uncharacterized protein LOC117344073 n=1 Tax=Pecten maximus TaxID=6579 RepID=UPI0014584CFE|nr:uncharacterized protein LOC117344073 [Pecten maximus]